MQRYKIILKLILFTRFFLFFILKVTYIIFFFLSLALANFM